LRVGKVAMPDTTSWISLNAEQKEELKGLVSRPPDGVTTGAYYRVLPQDEIPSVFPAAFREKCDHAVMMVSDVTEGTRFTGEAVASTVVVCNAQRVDTRAGAIDQEPFAIAVVGDEPAPSGVFVHHGSWEGRTETALARGFWDYVEESGVGDCFPFQDLPEGAAGPLDDLREAGHGSAFRTAIAKYTEGKNAEGNA